MMTPLFLPNERVFHPLVNAHAGTQRELGDSQNLRVLCTEIPCRCNRAESENNLVPGAKSIPVNNLQCIIAKALIKFAHFLVDKGKTD